MNDVQDINPADPGTEQEINSNNELTVRNQDANVDSNDYSEEPEAIYTMIVPKSLRPKKTPIQNDEMSHYNYLILIQN